MMQGFLTILVAISLNIVPHAYSFGIQSVGSKFTLITTMSKNGVENCKVSVLNRQQEGRSNFRSIITRRPSLASLHTFKWSNSIIMRSRDSGTGEEFVRSQRLDELDEAELMMQLGETYLPFGKRLIE